MKSLIKLIFFIFVFWGVSKILPYALTSVSYKNNQNISSHFPVAIVKNKKPEIITWSAYEESPHKYKDILLTPSTKETHQNFEIQPSSNGNINLKYSTENYDFWSTYSIKNGIVKPEKYKFTGVFIVGYTLIITALIVLLFPFLFAKLHYIYTQRKNKT